MDQDRSARRASRARTAALIAMQASLLLLAAGAEAATVTAYTSVTAFSADDEPIYDESESAICSSYSGDGSETQCQGALSGLQYNTFSSADYGVLKVFGAQSVGEFTGDSGLVATPSYVSAVGTALFRDQWTILGQPTGTTGTLQLSFDMTGDYQYTDINSGVQVGFGMFVFGTGPAQSNPTQVPVSGGFGSLAYTHAFTTQFTYGVPLDFQVFLTGGSVLYALDSDTNFRSSLFDLANTAVMNAIIVKDAGGNDVPFALNTASGAALFADLAPAVVPVPGAGWLLGSAMAGLMAWRRRRVAGIG
jgi:hypothetical protein